MQASASGRPSGEDAVEAGIIGGAKEDVPRREDKAGKEKKEKGKEDDTWDL